MLRLRNFITGVFGRELMRSDDADAARQLLAIRSILHGGFQTGMFYGSPAVGVTQSNTAVVANRIYAQFFPVYESATFDRIGVQTATGVAATSVRLGVYLMNAGRPSSLHQDLGTVETASAGAKLITINLTLPPGAYALAAVFNGAPTIVSASGSVAAHYWLGPSAMNWAGISGFATDNASAHAGLPSSFGAIGTFPGASPHIYLRAA